MSLDILIVDDHAPMRMMLRAVLERSGVPVHVREAGSGAKALALLLEQPADLVLCDQSMPHMSGVELVLRLRGEPRHAGLRVIMLSGHADPEFTRAAQSAGADAILLKPVKPSLLLRTISALMPGARAAVRA